MAVAGDGHFERLPDPGFVPLAGAAVDGALVLVAPDGGLVRSDGGAFAPFAPASGLDVAALAADGGAVYALQSQPAVVRRFDGAAWSAPEPVPVHFATTIAVEGDGSVWVGAMFGSAAHKPPGGAFMALEPLVGHLGVQVDPTGGVWIWANTAATDVHHALGGRVDRTVPLDDWWWQVGSIGVGPDGVPLALRDGLVVDVTAGTSRGPAAWLGEGPGGAWVAGPEGVGPLGGARVAVPARRVDRLWPPYVLADGALFEWVDGAAPPIRPASRSFGLGHLADVRQAVAADVDGDGDDDLFVVDEDGRLRLFRQDEASFVDDSHRVPADIRPGRLEFACDLDGDGRDELGFRVDGPDPNAPLRLLRPHRRWIEDATADLGALPVWVDAAIGRIGCVDLDRDGAPELVIPNGGRVPGARTVLVLRNDGFGRFTALDLPRRGLSAPRAFVRDVLFGDLDGDAHHDALLLSMWNYGHQVLLARDGGLVDATRASGLRGWYDEPRRGWLADVDRDGALDLLTHGRSGYAAWAGRGDGRFEDRRAVWGLFDRPPAFDHYGGDLDGDGTFDLLGVSPASLSSFRDGRFVSFDDALPELPAGTLSIAPADLGGDGDVDWLVYGTGGERWLENASGHAPASLAYRSGWVQRAASRSRGADRAVLALLIAVIVVIGRRAGAVVPRGGVVGAVASVLPVWLVVVGEAPVVRFFGLSVLAAATAGGAVWVGSASARARARTIAGYRLSTLLGRGATGNVYAARDPRTGADVAIKVIAPDLLESESDRALYRREAELGAGIDDPRVVRILGYGEWTVAEGLRLRPTAYLVLERVYGGSLRDRLDQGSLSVGEACAVAREVAKGLAAIHRAGVVHRDVKPENVALCRDGRVKLMDFGAARRLGTETVGLGRVLGTFGYLAPESAIGRPATPATDLYALGVVLYECLAGFRPFDDDDLVAVLTRRATPARPADVPDGVFALCAALLDVDPAKRPSDAESVAASLEPFCDRVPPVVEARPVAPEAPTGRFGLHLRTFAQVARLYVRHATRGGAPDRVAFAVGLMSVSDEETVRTPTSRGDP